MPAKLGRKPLSLLVKLVINKNSELNKAAEVYRQQINIQKRSVTPSLDPKSVP